MVQLYEQYPHDFVRVKANSAVAYFKLNQQDKTAEIVEYLKNRKTGLGSPAYCLGLIYTQMEEVDVAFEWLEKAYEDRQGDCTGVRKRLLLNPFMTIPAGRRCWIK